MRDKSYQRTSGNFYCAWEDFDPEIDAVCVILDRDYKGLTACLDEIFKLCLLT